MMTWGVVIALTAGAAALRLAGMFALEPVLASRPILRRVADLIPAAVVAAVIVQLTIVSRGEIVVDTRAVGIVTAGIFVWRRAPLVVVVIAAAVATAAVRALT